MKPTQLSLVKLGDTVSETRNGHPYEVMTTDRSLGRNRLEVTRLCSCPHVPVSATFTGTDRRALFEWTGQDLLAHNHADITIVD